MDKKSKILLGAFLLLVIGSVAVTYWRIMVKKDYMIQAQADCDPTVDKCFVWECDPESSEDGEACTGNPENDIWYYQIIDRKAANIPLCDPADENCSALVCEEGEEDCAVTFCDDTNKEEQGVECNDPEQYNIDNPVEEEEATDDSATCEEGDEECAAAADEEDATACDPESEDCSDDASDDTQGTDQTTNEAAGAGRNDYLQ